MKMYKNNNNEIIEFEALATYIDQPSIPLPFHLLVSLQKR